MVFCTRRVRHRSTNVIVCFAFSRFVQGLFQVASCIISVGLGWKLFCTMTRRTLVALNALYLYEGNQLKPVTQAPSLLLQVQVDYG
jgi:hypothetical protein